MKVDDCQVPTTPSVLETAFMVTVQTPDRNERNWLLSTCADALPTRYFVIDPPFTREAVTVYWRTPGFTVEPGYDTATVIALTRTPT